MSRVGVVASGILLNRGNPHVLRKRRWITNKGEAKEAWIVDYVDQAGDRHIQTFARKKEADDHWATVKVDVRKGVHIAPSKSPTVAEAADRWLREVQARNIEASTLARYRTHVNLHIVPAIGAVKLNPHPGTHRGLPR